MKKNNQKGITIISLIVTVIILLVLASVTITISLNNNSGVVSKAKDAKKKAESFSEYESIMEAVVTSKKKSGKIDFNALKDKVTGISQDTASSYNSITNEITIKIGDNAYVIGEYGGITETIIEGDLLPDIISPEGYTFIDYTTKSFETGIVPNNKIVEIDYRNTFQSNFLGVFGIQYNYQLYQAPWQSSWFVFMNSSDYCAIPNSEYTTRHVVKLSPPESKVYFDGSVVNAPTTRVDTEFTLAINAIKDSNGAISKTGTSVETYSFKVWDGTTNELELYALPVSENSTGTIKMYDLVNETFLTEL